MASTIYFPVTFYK